MQKKIMTILDGGMGRELAKRGAPFRQPEWSALAMIEAPDAVLDVHTSFIQAGAQVITTNSYALVPFHIGEERFEKEGLALAKRAGEVARQAVIHNANVRIAGSIPPLFGSYRTDQFEPDRVEEIALPLIKGLQSNIDFWLLETQSLIAEVVAVKHIIDEQTQEKKPLWVSFTLEDSDVTEQPCLRSGESVETAIHAMVKLGAEAILFNCCQPEVIESALIVAKRALELTHNNHIQLGAYANAFPPQPKDATANAGLDKIRGDLSPKEYLHWVNVWVDSGASLLGGCCGIGPEHIAVLSQNYGELEV